MKNQTILLVAGAGLVAWYMFHKQTTAAVTPNIAPPAPPPTGTGPTGGSDANVPITSPGATQETVISTNPLATVAQQQTIFNWAHGLNGTDQAAFFIHWPDMSAGDIANLMDWIVNLWPSGKPPTATQTAAWNAWRIKYQIAI